MTSTVEADSEAELSKLIDEWRKEYQKPNYNPVPFLTNCSRILEPELAEFHKGDPDPWDQRHPKHVLPDCKFGKLLTIFESCSELLNMITTSYLVTRNQPPNVGSTVIAAARLALVAGGSRGLKGLDTEEWIKNFISWIIEADEPLRTYATGLLVGKDIMHKATVEEITRLITTLLKRLWNYIEPNKYDEPKCMVRLDKHDDVSTKKRKRLSETNMPNPKIMRVEAPKKVVKDDDVHDTLCENDLSNSSWAEQMPAILGSSYSLEPPLSENLRQVCIFDLIQAYGDFQDLLSSFVRLDVLELVLKYLKNKFEGQLTYKVLEFLSSLFCYNKLAMKFIELDGIQNLLLVPRPSMGSTGVAFCLYQLAYRKEVIEKICQPVSELSKEIVKYAIWLLECSHESGRSHIASFFSMTFVYKNILNLFDSMDGLRCLINMASTAKPIAADDGFDSINDDEFKQVFSQIIKPVCVTLRRYFEAHVIFKVGQAVKSNHTLKQKYSSFDSTTKYEPSSHTRDQYFEYIDVLKTLAEGNNSFNLDCWSPIAFFQKLDGVPLMLKVVSMATDMEPGNTQIEIIRAALDVLSVVTLSRPCQMVLTRRHPNLGMEETGMYVIMTFILGYDVEYTDQQTDSVAINSALAVISNCTGSSYYKIEDDGDPMKACSTPRLKKKRSKLKETLCKLIQQSDGILVLLKLLESTEPAQTADETRYLACRALLGLSEYKPIRQILSKLQVFVNGKLFTACKEPILKDKKHLHKKLCDTMEILLKKVTGKAITLDGDLKTAQRTDIVSETRVQYNNKDVLSMIHSHLVWSGLHTAADALAQESGITTDQEDFKFATPKLKKLTFQGGDCDGSVDSTPKLPKITFSRGNRASSGTPTSSSIISLKTPLSQRRTARSDMMTPISRGNKKYDRFTLSRGGFVTVDPRPNRSRRSPSPVTLNSIIVEYFQHQHSKCRNPVVTVPQFSLFTPHRCPEPRNKIEASTNATRRLHIRQGICPKWGGINGMTCDLRLIYSRFKPVGTIKCTEERNNVHFTSVAFLPDGDCQLVFGDSAGNVQMPGPYEETIIHGVSNSPIIHMEPSNLGDVMLTVSPTIWSSKCTLLAINDQLEQKLTFDDIDYVEFSKAVQDKILGTNESKATVFDAATGHNLNEYDKEELACNYKYNCATFSYDDKLILSDGLLWDVRKAQTSPIHKFDKFNPTVSGVFHPNGIEVIINTEVWDIRNFGLSRTVPAFDQCSLFFNRSRSVIYATKMGYVHEDDDSSKACKGLAPAFKTFDSTNYDQLGFVAVKQPIYALALDCWDRNIAVIETPNIDDAVMSVCRLYEVGLARDDNEEEVEEGDVESSEDDDDDERNGILNPDDDEFSLGPEDSFDTLSENSLFENSELEFSGSSDAEWETTDED